MSRPARHRRTRRALRQSASQPGTGPRRQRSLRFEPLECRRLLAITVNTPFDELDGSIVDGDVSLRDAIAAAPAGETINFDPALTAAGPTTIVLAFGELLVNKPLTITGPGANLLTVDGRNRGRIFNVDDSTAALVDVAINGLTLTGGRVLGFAFGGAIRNAENLALSGLAIAGNSAFFGGGVWNGAGKLTVINSTVSGNSASNGGGIFSGGAGSTQTTTIVNSTISGNTASIAGGGLFCFDGVTTVRHSTITNNMSSGDGDGVASYANATTQTKIYSTIIAGNPGGDVDLFGGTGTNSFHSDGYNLIGDGSGLADFSNNDQTNVSDPLLGPLAENGGPTRTHALLNGSLAANAGDPAAVAGMGGVPTFDQRGDGFPRVVYGRIDIGAFEAPFVVGADLVVDTLTDELDGNIDPGDLSLREAIGLANLDLDVQAISFAPALTSGGPAAIKLLLGELLVSQPLTITGSGANLLTLDADGDSRVFHINNGADETLITVTLSGLTLTGGNVAASGDGGAIFNRENLTVLHSVISGNSAVGGGGIYSRDGSLIISQSTLSGNSASLYGGGVQNLGGNLLVTDSTLFGNSAKGGGGITSDTNLTNRTTTITGSTISGNTATERGGGVFNLQGLAVLRHSTVTNNTAPAGSGSGVASHGTELTRSEVYSTIVTGNTNSDVDVVAGASSSFLSLGYNFVGTGSGTSAFTKPGDGTGLVNVQLGPLANNGGPTRTHALLLNSPAINAGDPAAVAGMGGVPAFDQRGSGFPRIVYGRIDVGAFEAPFVAVASLVVDTLTDELDGNLAPGDLSLREAIGLANLDPDVQAITFASALTSGGPAVIKLLLGELPIQESLTITGPGANLLTLDADGDSRLLNINDGASSSLINVTLNGLTLTGGNVATSGDGGAISNHENLSVLRSVISGNAAVGGGGIYNHDGSLTITQSTLAGNSATLYGGAILNIGGNVTLTDSTLSGNSAKGGGGLASDTNLTNRTTTITGSTISGNTATERGGGVLNLEGLTVLRHSTLTNNTAPTGSGGGVASFATELTRTEVHSTLVTGNINSDVSVVAGGMSSFLSLGYNLVGTGSGTSAFTMPGDQAGLLNVQLGSLANNGGPTRTHALLLNSPAINAGDPAAVAGMGGVPTFDQRGESFSRVAGGRIDVGAFENQKPDIVVDILADESDGNVSAGDLSLREAIALANSRSDAPVIQFATALTSGSPATIMLSLGELVISGPVSVIGPGANLLTIDANDTSRLFRIDDGGGDTLIDVEIGALTLTDGKSATTGGAILNLETLTLSRVAITENFANLGGAVSSSGDLSVVDSTISGNTATGNGGGIHSTGKLLVSNSTISGNAATADGGGIFTSQNMAVIRHSTITANNAQASRGGGIASIGPNAETRVHSTIVSRNSVGDVDFLGVGGNSFKSDGYNLIGVGSAIGAFNQPGDLIGFSNALLSPLASNGGPTKTHALLSNSPAINAGDPTAASGMGGVPEFDQRGASFPRVQNGRIDIGAYESPFFVGITIAVDTLVDELDGNIGPGDLSLREAIGLANLEPDFQTITFAPALTSGGPATISLALGELAIRETVTINGPGANLLSIDAHNASRVLVVDDGTPDNTRVIEVTLRGLTITGGRVVGFNYGGGILNHEDLTITSSAIVGNSANFFGGGIWTGSAGLRVNDSTISGNQASHGAGIFRGAGPGTAPLILNNSTVSGNTATVSGGGLLNMSGLAAIRHSTITANTAPMSGGSGVASYGTSAANTAAYTSIIAGNHGSDVDLFGGTTNSFHSLGFNLIGTGSALAAFSNNDQTGITDPRLMPLANNGGPTRTHAHAAGSPAVDAGDPAAVAGMVGVPEFDQRGSGFTRVAHGRIDIGAFESQVNVPTLAGDYNQSGAVNAADYVVWRKSLGSTVPPFSGADGDGSGIVDQTDLVVWQANFGRTLSPAATTAAISDVFVDAAHDESVPEQTATIISEPADSRQSGTLATQSAFAFVARPGFLSHSLATTEAIRRRAAVPRPLFPASHCDLLVAFFDIDDAGPRRENSPSATALLMDARVDESLDAVDLAFEFLGVGG